MCVYRETYEVVKKIGEGGFGKMFIVKNKENNEVFAAKCIRARLNRDKVKSKQEIALLKSLHNDFIISFVDAFEGPAEIILVTEYLEGGELFDRIVDETFELLESDCCFFIRQVCKGLDYLHRNNIVHLDIKVRIHRHSFHNRLIFHTCFVSLSSGMWCQISIF